jgi:MoxR-like ATPase
VTDVLPTALQEMSETIAQVRAQLSRVIRGQENVVEHMLITLVCGGHALLEGVPGTAKTLTVRTLARTVTCDTKRIQFTPDLMPSDIVGTNVFNLATNAFSLHKGPVFTDLLLADEINRAPAKTQSALLEAMSERRVTIDGVRHELSPIFTVFATQNPVEFEGTYPLPEAQQDRFLLKIPVGYPSLDAERSVLKSVHEGQPPDRLTDASVDAVVNVQGVLKLREALSLVRVDDGVMEYILKAVRSTRQDESIQLGAGPRGSIFLLTTSKARALLAGRDFVTPDDVVAMIGPVLGHRITLSAEAEVGGMTRQQVLQSIMDKIEVPR